MIGNGPADSTSRLRLRRVDCACEGIVVEKSVSECGSVISKSQRASQRNVGAVESCFERRRVVFIESRSRDKHAAQRQ